MKTQQQKQDYYYKQQYKVANEQLKKSQAQLKLILDNHTKVNKEMKDEIEELKDRLAKSNDLIAQLSEQLNKPLTPKEEGLAKGVIIPETEELPGLH